MTALANLITESALEELAGDRSFERGLAYFRSGAVERLISHKNRISARVAGTEVYTVKLWPEGRRLGWDCSCPMGQDGEFCKHLVATGLAWLAAAGNSDAQTSSEIEAIRSFLETMDKHALLDMLTERACEDEDLAAQLLLVAQRHGVSDPAALKEVIRKAFASSGFVDYHRMPEVARRAAAVPELLHELSKRGDAKAAAELSADAMKRGLKLLERSDDSDGGLGGSLSTIAEIHLQSAGKAGLAPAQLAKDLFDLQLAETAWKRFPPGSRARAITAMTNGAIN